MQINNNKIEKNTSYDKNIYDRYRTFPEMR